jgi:hypothetical protein
MRLHFTRKHVIFTRLRVGFCVLIRHRSYYCTVKTGVSFRHLLRQTNSASASVVSTLKSVCLSVKTTLRLSYRVLEITLSVSF